MDITIILVAVATLLAIGFAAAAILSAGGGMRSKARSGNHGGMHDYGYTDYDDDSTSVWSFFSGGDDSGCDD